MTTSPLTNRLRVINRTYALSQSEHGAIRQAALLLDALSEFYNSKAPDAHEQATRLLREAGLVPHE